MTTTKDETKKSENKEPKKEKFDLKINKDKLINTLMILLLALVALQTWQLTSLYSRVAEAKELQLKNISAPASQPAQPSSQGGVNSLPSQVGGC